MAAFAGPILDYLGRMPILPLTLVVAASVTLVGAPPITPAATTSAETRRALWISLADKPLPRGGVRPEHTELTPRALARRAQHRTMPGLVDARDLPVDPARLGAVLATGARFRAKSRWLNGISVDATDAEARAIAALPFVASTWSLHRSHAVLPPVGVPAGEGDAGEGGVAGGHTAADYGLMYAQVQTAGIPPLHTRGFHGEGLVIGVLDTGFHRVHEAFHSAEHPLQVIAEWDFIGNDGNTGIEASDPAGQHQHGTWILGTLAAYRPGEAIGCAYAARYVLAKTEVVPTETVVEEDYYVAGLEFIEAQGADLATSSLGYIDWYTPAQLDGLTAITTRAVNLATANGLVCLTAAGNAGHDADPATNRLLAPADAFDVISCGAVDANGVIAGFSSDGPSADGRVKPELLARGVGTVSVHSTNPTGYQALNGTSLSTPIVAGAVALVKQARPELGVTALRNLLFTNAGDWFANGAADPLHVRGYGQVSAFGTATSGRLPEDINLDGTVGAVDLARVLSAWGACVQPDPVLGVCPEDLDGDGQIGAPDLARILSAWGG